MARSRVRSTSPRRPGHWWFGAAAWFEAAPRVLADGGRRHGGLLAAVAAVRDTSAWRDRLRADLADWQAAGPVTGSFAPVTAFFSALAAGDTARAAALAQDLSARPRASGAERVVWHLRAAALSPPGDIAWAGADTLLSELGPWDAANTWALAVALRRSRGQAPSPGTPTTPTGARWPVCPAAG